MNLTFDQLSILESQEFTLYKHFYVDICSDDVLAGILLSKIVYWFGRNKETGNLRVNYIYKGKRCLVKRRCDWWDECRLSERVFDRCMKILKEKNFVISETHKSPFHGNDTAMYIFLNEDILMSTVNKLLFGKSPDSNKNDDKPADIKPHEEFVIPESPNGDSLRELEIPVIPESPNETNQNYEMVIPSYIAMTMFNNNNNTEDDCCCCFSEQDILAKNKLMRENDLPEIVIKEFESTPLEQVQNALLAVEAYEKTKAVPSRIGLIRTAIREAWQPTKPKEEPPEKKIYNQVEIVKTRCEKLYDNYKHLFTATAWFNIVDNCLSLNSPKGTNIIGYLENNCVAILEKFIEKELKHRES